MVEPSSKKRVRIGREHFNRDSRLGFKPDRHICVLCLEVPIGSPILEC